VLRLNHGDPQESSNLFTGAEEPNELDPANPTQINTGAISIEEEFRFMLLRHWNLYDSAYYSNYVAAKFSIWKQPGVTELNRFFVSIGVPLQEAKQQYRFMKVCAFCFFLGFLILGVFLERV
jgi:cell division control protein 45